MKPIPLDPSVHKVKKFTVRDQVSTSECKASTIVKIYYRGWWRLPCEVKFTRDDVAHFSTASYERHPEAQALIEKLKRATGRISSATRQTPWREKSDSSH